MKLEMRAVKNIAAAAMTLAVVFGFASLKPVTASAAQAEAPVSASIEEENSYISYQDEIYQKDFLRLVNKERAKSGLHPVRLGETNHTEAAHKPAEAIATDKSKERREGKH